MRLVSLAKVALALAVLGAVGCGTGTAPATAVRLTFPFMDPSAVVEIHNFALHPWSDTGETHSGIDIVPPYLDLAGTDGMRKIAIVAPADGVIAAYAEDVSGAGLKSYAVVFQINTYWYLLMNFEPQSADAGTDAAQTASFTVSEGDAVKRGDKIADLVVSKVEPGRYPHLHFGIFYKPVVESFTRVFESLAVSNGSEPSPEILETDLNKQSIFYCPYDYFLAAGQAVVDAVPKLDLFGNECSCACSYGSLEGSCGSCP